MRIAGISFAAFWLLGALFPVASAENRTSIVLDLKAATEVSANQVILSDVAVVSCDDKRLENVVSFIPLGPGPSPGGHLSITQKVLGQWMRFKHPELASRVVWNGASVVQVQRTSGTVSRSSVGELAASSLKAMLEKKFSEVVVTAESSREAINVPAGVEVSMKARVPPYTSPAKRMLVYVDLMEGGTRVKTVPVYLAVSAHARVWTAKAVYPADTVLDPSWLLAESVDVTSLTAEPVATALPLENLKLKRPIKTGEVLTTADFYKASDVTAYHEVEVTVRSGAVQLVSRGKSLQNGNVGRQIRIQNPKSEGIFLATVTGKDAVAIERSELQ